MGVADGVGGRSKSQSRPSSTPSAFFACRLMHYRSVEGEASMTPPSSHSGIPPVTPVPILTPPPATSYSGSSRPVPPAPTFPPLTTPNHIAQHPYHKLLQPVVRLFIHIIRMSSSLPTSWTLHDIFAASAPPPPPEPAAPEPSYLSERGQESPKADLPRFIT
ncbi:hypothetical protein P691DRAFT_779431 [Macrolepiota fuliginosa MF-IS2]|uniref:Uncharacterized protein n=1 Tax=Macrolepiota fuliginosa MF-IS2 TaxID=1400762 RepID=A0A9P5X0I5_9AGAR|nr:hypothetical protein P691DRAFT_779431 [Macrolepiota fuliginosa MF-IS2]